MLHIPYTSNSIVLQLVLVVLFFSLLAISKIKTKEQSQETKTNE